MKRCPKCNADYFDNMLEFCLEDGTKLLFVHGTQPGSPPITKPNPAAPTIAQSPFPVSSAPNTLEFPRNAEVETVVSTVDKNALPVLESHGIKALEIAPIIIALAHNWWQWLYLEKQYVSSITDYILSANFLMWLLLLAAGVTTGLLGLRHSKNKTFAYTSLIVLAINLILFLVPRR